MIGSQVYSETYAVILALGEDYIKRIPENVWEFIKNQSNEYYMPQIDPNKGLSEQGLTKESLAMIATLRLNYLCDSEQEKTDFLAYLETNEQELKEVMMSTTSARELLRMMKNQR